MIKELTADNFPEIDMGIPCVTYVGFPMPNVENYVDLNIFGMALNETIESFVDCLEKSDRLRFCYSPEHFGEENHLWELIAYAKYEASTQYPDSNVVFLYYSPSPALND